eukprot:TRINITY_DN3892_c0_g1_i1.p1 TRINITY_DN3892_c0_g1~~TRINITY_DN3892_c0_g1_i1.p1  ORF type:complete len:217 (+),score=80.65 TRINITY_DN3892_c0_g1_i1:115-765(+)
MAFDRIPNGSTALVEVVGFDRDPYTEEHPRHNKNPEVGKKKVNYSGKLWLEPVDMRAVKVGEEVTLMRWGNFFVREVNEDADGRISAKMEFNPEGNPKTTKAKLTWISADDHHVPVTIREFNPLITVEKVADGMTFADVVSPQICVESRGVGEEALKDLNVGDRLQLERRGYAIVDAKDDSGMVLNMIPDGKAKSMSVIEGQVKRPAGGSSSTGSK